MPDLNRIKMLERGITFGDLKKEDLSPEDRKNLEEYQKEKHKESSEKTVVIETEKLQRFISTVSPFLPQGNRNIKLLGGNWFTFELDNKKFMLYYYYPTNITFPVFTCMTQI